MLPDVGPDRELGLDWPVFAQTMIGRRRIASLRSFTETVITEDVPGDLIEAGVWRGGVIMMRAVLEAYGARERQVWLADSFAGLPPPHVDLYRRADAGAVWHESPELAVSLEEVRGNVRRYGLLDDQVRLLPGWFSDTLPDGH